MENHTTQSSDGRIGESTAVFDARSKERSSSLSEHTEETHSVERNLSTSAAPDIEVGNEGNTQNASRITTDASSTLQKPSSVALSETDGNSGFQSVYSSEPQLNASVVTSSVMYDSISVSVMTSPLVNLEDNNRGVTSVYGNVLEESTTGAFKPEPSDAEATVKSSSGTFNMSSLETVSEETDAVTSDSQPNASSTDPMITADSEHTTNLLGSGWHAEVTGTLGSADANTTISELTTGTSDNFTVSEVEHLSHESFDSSFQHANVSEVVVSTPNATTSSSLSSSAEERGPVTETHVPWERQHTSSRTVEDTSTTDAPSAHLSTSEATRTQHTNGTGPVTKAQFYSQAGDQFSTVSEVASESPYGSTSSSNGQFIGIVVGASVGVVILVIIIIIIGAVLYRRKRRQSCYISNDYDLRDYRSLMKQRPHDATAMASPSVAQPISPFCDVFPQDVANNGLPASKYRMMNFDRNSDDGLDGMEIVHDDNSRTQRSPKEIPIEEYDPNPSGYSDCSYSVNTFRPPERKNEKKSTDLTQPEAETKLDANKSSGNDEKAIEE